MSFEVNDMYSYNVYMETLYTSTEKVIITYTYMYLVYMCLIMDGYNLHKVTCFSLMMGGTDKERDLQSPTTKSPIMRLIQPITSGK